MALAEMEQARVRRAMDAFMQHRRLSRDSRPPPHIRPKLKSQWALRISALIASGQGALAAEARQFVNSFAPALAEAECLALGSTGKRTPAPQKNIDVPNRKSVAHTR